MSFDGILVPDWAKPYVGWVVGMDWPEGDERPHVSPARRRR